MNNSSKVKVTKTRQQPAREKVRKAGVAYKGANSVAQREASAKKNAAKAAAGRKKK